ncbi:NIPA-like protein [Senna tora]|uniref:NIPA-like protein n=1 Tax=Senna tora TaxID=362788 RepID=A0A834WMQ5_9FABA|nr:NIPA-like protein [Senna tora]
MKEDVVSSKHTNSNANDPSLPKLPSSPPTPAASSVGASSPAVPAIDGSLPQRISLSGLSNPSCRPWERGDLLRRLSTFKLTGKAKVAGSLACAKRGWVNSDVNKIECELCGAKLDFSSSTSSVNFEDASSEELSEQLDRGHKVTCPWRGNSCPESLVQFPPTSPSALIGGFKDRCDGLLQFYSLPVVSSSAVEQMRLTRGPQIDRFLALLQIQTAGELGYKAENVSGMSYSGEQAQKLISLCGWEARWLPNVLDCEEQSAESAKNDNSSDPAKGSALSRKEFSTTSQKDTGGNEVPGSEFNCESRSPLLDCSLCGATVRVWDFLTVTRPVHFAPCSVDTPQLSKKMASTRGISAASGINEWAAADDVEKEHTDDHDEAATSDKRQLVSNRSVDINLKMTDGQSCSQMNMTLASDHVQDHGGGRDLMIGQPSGSEVGDKAASYESQGPNPRKRRLDNGGSTGNKTHLGTQRANSAEGIIVDCGNNEVTCSQQHSASPSKLAQDTNFLEKFQLSCRRDSSGAVPSHSLDTQIEADASTGNPFNSDRDNVGIPPTRDSTHASSIIAMDTVYHSSDDESMESVENFPVDVNDVSFHSVGLNEASELNSSYQAQHSAWSQPVLERAGGEAGVSSSNACGEVLNTDTLTAHARDVPSVGISGGSVGMGASHEAEIHGTGISAYRGDSLGDVEPEAEVIEHQGQAGEFAPYQGLTGDFVPEEMSQEDPHGDSQAAVSQSTARTDSGSKIVVSTKVESVESGEKTSSSMQMQGNENGAHPSLSCNAVVCSAYEASKEEVTQTGKASHHDDGAYIESGYVVADDMGTPYRDKIIGGVEFDPIKQHNDYCPWVNGYVAAAGCDSPLTYSGADAIALCGWQLTLDALDSFQSLGRIPVQTVESESAASLCKGDRLAPSKKLLASNSFVIGRGKN